MQAAGFRDPKPMLTSVTRIAGSQGAMLDEPVKLLPVRPLLGELVELPLVELLLNELAKLLSKEPAAVKRSQFQIERMR